MSITVRAPARVSVFLRVGSAGRDGYHDMASLYQAVSLYDEVTAEAAEDFSVRFSGAVDTQRIPQNANSIAVRAAKMLAEHTGVRQGVALSVLKRIPLGSGLGGASANVAGTLVACDELWGTHVGKNVLSKIAAKLGPEIPFSIAGGTAVWSSEGKQFSPALSKGKYHWVLAFTSATWEVAKVLRTLEQHRQQNHEYFRNTPKVVEIEAEVMQAIRQGDSECLAQAMHNDLQVAAMKLDPELGALLELGESRGALAGIVSGVGSTVAFLTDGITGAESLSRVLNAEGVATLIVNGPVSGARRIDNLPETMLTQPIPIRDR